MYILGGHIPVCVLRGSVVRLPLISVSNPIYLNQIRRGYNKLRGGVTPLLMTLPRIPPSLSLLCFIQQFRREEDAERALVELNNRWFNGQAIHAELSPVTDFRESCCRQYEMG